MRIAVFDNLPEGGAKRVVFEQVKYLSKRHTVIYYTNTRQSIFQIEKYATAVIRTPLEFKRFMGLQRPLQELQFFSLATEYHRIAKSIEKNSCDAVLVHPCMHTQAPLLLLFTTLPTLYYAHEPLRIVSEPDLFPIIETNFLKYSYEYLRRKFVGFLDMCAVAHVSAIACNSTFTAQNILQQYARPAAVVHPGVDKKIFKPKKLKKKHFLFIGEKESINGYDLLEAAVPLLPKKVVIKYLSFKNSRFSVSDTELVNLICAAYATLCISKQEPFGLIAVESIVCGTPVIAVNEGGYKETVSNKTGIVIARKKQELAQAITKIFTSVNVQKKLAQNCLIEGKGKFSWEEHGKKIADHLSALLSK